MKQLVVLLVSLLTLNSALAYVESQLEFQPDHKVYYRYQKAKAGKPTVVMMNGLIYAVENQDEYFQFLADQGLGVLQIAYSTQPESLRLLEGKTPYFVKATYSPLYGWTQKGIETQDLVDETMAVIDELNIKKFNLVSLSYGSIPAIDLASQYKDRIQHLVLISPAVVTSGRYNPYGSTRHAWYRALKFSGNAYADYFYDAEIGNTLALLVTPQKYSFESVQFKDFYSGVYQMARSSKWFDLKHSVGNELPPTSLFVASLEESNLAADQMKFWELMSNNPAKKSLVVFEGSYHAIPGVAPEAAAEQTMKAISNNLSSESVVKVGTGNPPETIRNSLLNYTELSADSWGSSH